MADHDTPNRPGDEAKDVSKRKTTPEGGRGGHNLRVRGKPRVQAPPQGPQPHKRRPGYTHPKRDPNVIAGGGNKPRKVQGLTHRYRTVKQKNTILKLTTGFRKTVEGTYQKIADISNGNWHMKNAGK